MCVCVWCFCVCVFLGSWCVNMCGFVCVCMVSVGVCVLIVCMCVYGVLKCVCLFGLILIGWECVWHVCVLLFVRVRFWCGLYVYV